MQQRVDLHLQATNGNIRDYYKAFHSFGKDGSNSISTLEFLLKTKKTKQNKFEIPYQYEIKSGF